MMGKIMEKIDRRKVGRRETDRREVDRRIAERFKLPLKGTVVFAVGGKFWRRGKEKKRDITVRNISAYGAYFTADLRPAVSNQLTLHLPIEQAEGSFEAAATVVRVEDDSDNRFGIAVAFEKIPDFG